MRITSAFLLALFLLAPALPLYAAEGELTVTPVIINEKTKIRDIIKEEITVTNTSERKINLYPSVYDVNPTEGETGFERAEDSVERAVSLANWIELSRGVVELGPGEEKIIPFAIRVHQDAAPGMYHAHISFSEGTTREEAETAEPISVVTVNLEVEADIREVLQLNKFFTDNVLLSGDDVLFNYQIENIGNRQLKPSGEIRIYNRAGKEVASVPVNKDGEVFSPEQKAQLASVWSGAEGFGKYKAFLTMNYGSNQTASVQDTVFFWIVPWKEIVISLVIGFALVVFLVLYFHRQHERRLALHGLSGSFVPVIQDAVHGLTTHTSKLRLPSLAGLFRKKVAPHPLRRVHVPEEPHPIPFSGRNAAQSSAPSGPEFSVDPPQEGDRHTINLKNFPHARKADGGDLHDGHVINLKK